MSLRPLMLWSALAVVAGGCTALEPLPGRYSIVPSETQRICLVHARAFWESGTLEAVPTGKIHWIEEPRAILEFIGAMEGEELTETLGDPDTGRGGHRALVMLFFPEDAYSRRALELDENLDIMPNYTQHGTPVTRPPFRTSPKFKRAVLDVLGGCRACRDYLGIHPRIDDAPAQ